MTFSTKNSEKVLDSAGVMYSHLQELL